MKTIKYLFAGALSLLMMTTFTSCSEDEASYTPAQPVSGDQVFFPSSNVSAIDLSSSESSFEVTIARVDTTKAADVALNCTTTDTLGLFTLPTTAHFEKGAGTTTVTVGYDAEAIINTIGYAAYNDIEIAIADETNTTPYAIAKYVVTVGIPEPWSEWEPFATGTYTYSLFWAGDDTGRKIYYRKYLLDETTAQFKVEGVMAGIDLIIDYNTETGACVVPMQYTAYDDATYGSVWVGDMLNYPFTSTETYEQFPCTFNAETGTFSLSLVYFVCTSYGGNANGTFGKGVETIQLDGYTVTDYSVAMNYVGIYNTPNGKANAVAEVTLGADAENAVVAMVEGKDVNAALTALISGELEGQTVEESGYVAFPIEASGTYSFVAVTYLEGDVMEYNYKTFNAVVGASDVAGPAKVEDYVGNWVIPGEYNGEVYNYNVEISAVEEEGVTYLLCKGSTGALGVQFNYDDTFMMIYDAETGSVALPAQNMPTFSYEEGDFSSLLAFVTSAGGITTKGSLVGNIAADGSIVFENAEGNEDEIVSFALGYIDGTSFYLLSDLLQLEWTRAEESAEAPAVRSFGKALEIAKPVKTVKSGLSLQQF